MVLRSLVVASLLVLAQPATAVLVSAAEEPVFTIDMADGVLKPSRLEVPAGKAFKLEVTNSGSAPAEFESKTLRKEKVIAPKAKARFAIKQLAAGEYDFFDELQPKAAPGVIVAK
jgi:hypothetical protein